MKRMRACESCHRHVFTTERTCPFCATELAPVPDVALPVVPSTASRAQRLALAAAIGGQTLLAACAQTTPDPLPAPAGNGQVAVPVYGAPAPITPPVAGAPASAGRDAPPRAGSGPIAVPVYGAPIAGHPASDDDAGVPEAGKGAAGKGAAGSGGLAGRGSPVPVYGAPVPVYGAPPTPKKD